VEKHQPLHWDGAVIATRFLHDEQGQDCHHCDALRGQVEHARDDNLRLDWHKDQIKAKKGQRSLDATMAEQNQTHYDDEVNKENQDHCAFNEKLY
jgi:hypothetical protein